MSRIELPERILFRDLPNSKDEQFFMRRLSVYNWGTFSKIHTLHFAEDGSLILGPSGAGKSTLLDAISAMIVPPKNVRFNAAAEEGDRRGHDRTISSYVRGAWADKGDVEARDTMKQYLRDSATSSAIALEFGNRLGSVLTLVRIFWITGASSSANINQHFLVAENSFDLKDLIGFDADMRKLRAILKGMEGVESYDTFAEYQHHWTKVMGIDDPSALELLHKTQSTKSVGDLNSFLRQFMLEEPETFEKADALVKEFGELDEAHKAVIAARDQIAVLHPARTAYENHARITEERATKASLREAAAAFIHSVKVRLIEEDNVRRQTLVNAAKGQQTNTLAKVNRLQELITDLERQHLAAGGADIQTIESRIKELEGDRDRRDTAKRRTAALCQVLGLTLAEDPSGFAEQLAQAQAIAGDASDRESGHLQQHGQLSVKKHTLTEELKQIRKEVEGLEKSPINIPRELQDLRNLMCADLHIPAPRVAFAGELIQVRKEYLERWAGAAERLLGGFGKDLLVDDRHHKDVARWVNQRHLGLKLGYQPVKAGVAHHRSDPRTGNSIIDKLELKDSPFTSWVQRVLLDRFDYECVTNAADLAGGDRRITAEGQIRHSGGRTEKDDRFELNNRRRWVLGFDSRDKLEAYREEAHRLGTALAETLRKLDTLESERQQDGLRKTAAEKLIDYDWESIDVMSVAETIAQQQLRLANLKSGNATLSDLDGQLTKARMNKQAADEELAELRTTIRDNEDAIKISVISLQTSRVEAGALKAQHREALAARLTPGWNPTLKTLESDVRQISDQIYAEMMKHVEELADLKQKIVSAFEALLRQWPEEAGSLQPNLESAPDFFARLKRLEDDGLPEHEERFRNLLTTQSTQRLAELSKHVTEGRRSIDARLADVNDSLHAVPYNQDSFLRITVVDIPLSDLADFRKSVASIFENQRQVIDDTALLEERFQMLRTLVMKLRAETTEHKQWRNNVLDVRLHVEFSAEELDLKSEHQIQVYGGSSGQSGGQRQKLTATCLAAALRYKLGGGGGSEPTYAAVVLDEAFTKTDPEFTRVCLQVFKELGFQLIVATPLKGVSTIEEFIGGACYVTIKNRNKSAVKQIEYEPAANRLLLSDEDRAQANLNADR